MTRVITYGVFDLFHEGHRRLLQRAKDLGDYLIVGITDNIYDELRGKLGTVDSFEVRKANVLATGFVDEVIAEDHFGQKQEDVQRLDIDIFAIGSDWVGQFDYLRPHCQVVYLDRTPNISSSRIREERFPTLKIGIIGSGRITRRFVREAREAGRVDVRGVYNPNAESAILLQSQFKLDFATGDIGELFDKVDAVYIATPHELHAPYARQALEAGKHVLVEKPMALSRADAEALFELASQRGLVLMEALKTAYAPGFCKLVDLVESGIIGDVVDVESCFTRLTAKGSRERDDVRFGGSFLEFGSYALLPMMRLLGCNPEDVRFGVLRDDNGLDLFTKVHLSYGSTFGLGKVGLGVKSQGSLVVSGTRGNIVVAPPWWKTRHCEVHFEDPSQVKFYDFAYYGDGLRYEISDFAHRVMGHEGRRDKLPAEESIAIAAIMERFLQQENRR